jgi:hypothetical protein
VIAAQSPELLDQSEALAWQDSFAAAPADYRTRSGMFTVATAEGYSRALHAAPNSLFNRFILPTGDHPPFSGEVKVALDWLSLHAGPTPAVDTCAPPGSTARKYIEDAGFRLSNRIAKFRRDASPVPSGRQTTLAIREIGAEQGNDFASIVCRGFGVSEALAPWVSAMPGRSGWRIYLGYADDVPVAAGAMHIQGKIAWLGWGVTLPEFRARGGQNAVLARRLQDGIDAGVGLFNIDTGYAAEDGEPGISYRNIERAGFTLSHMRHVFQRPAVGQV